MQLSGPTPAHTSSVTPQRSAEATGAQDEINEARIRTEPAAIRLSKCSFRHFARNVHPLRRLWPDLISRIRS